ncbi:MAG: serpin family protein [Candidatus Brocadiia bacterium]
MSKILVLALLAVLGVGATVWYVQRTPVVAPAPAVSETSPLPSPAVSEAPPVSDAEINEFDFDYAAEIADTDGSRNMVFSPFTTYVQLLFLERVANHVKGVDDSPKIARQAQLLDSLLADAAFKFSSEFIVSADMGIDSWTSREFARNKIEYSIDPARLGKMPSRFSKEELELPGWIHGLWISKFELNGTWAAFGEVTTVEASFLGLGDKSIECDFVRLWCSAKSNFSSEDSTLVLEIPYNEGYSLLTVMPEKWDTAKALETLETVISGETALEKKLSIRVMIPKFSIKCADPIDPMLDKMGYLATYTRCIPLVGTRTRDMNFIVKVDAKAKILCNEQGTKMEAETGAGFVTTGYGPRKPLVLDHPFLYALRHDATGIIVGLGWVVDPTSGIEE